MKKTILFSLFASLFFLNITAQEFKNKQWVLSKGWFGTDETIEFTLFDSTYNDRSAKSFWFEDNNQLKYQLVMPKTARGYCGNGTLMMDSSSYFIKKNKVTLLLAGGFFGEKKFNYKIKYTFVIQENKLILSEKKQYLIDERSAFSYKEGKKAEKAIKKHNKKKK